ncbi:MAG: hypothetical protein HYZ87_05025 [Candidatus Omnitrophica bacterium]|nr:hypothetical protein [Candidatus Omnitrophota bacterium]
MFLHERKVIGVLAALVAILLAARIYLNADRSVHLTVSNEAALSAGS